MLRSLLSVLADQPDDFDAACRTAADGLCLDLEDGVPATSKSAARALATRFLNSYGRPAPLWVRVNALDTGMCADDLHAVVGPALAGIQLPKVETQEDIREIDRMLTCWERSAVLDPGSVKVIATLESAIGIRNAYEIASVRGRLIALMPAIGGGGDLQRDLGYTTTTDQLGFLHARSRVVLAARAAGIVPLDGVHVDVELDSFELSASTARTLGYRGKKIFHHAHVQPANRIFGV
jgi:citrate lyase subunit beta/citryl-CoA lyase